MSYKLRDLDNEIAAKVDGMSDAIISKTELVMGILGDHDDISGEDADFALCAANEMVKSRVERYWRTLKAADEDDEGSEQLLMEGFEHLQRRYILPRGDEAVAVPVRVMTDEELIAKADEHRRMGAGHFAHADELDRYRSERAATNA